MIDPAAATGLAHTLLAGVAAKRGHVPGMVRVLANAPAALAGYLGFSAHLGNGVLSAALRERIAVAVAAVNGCAPCLMVHTRLGRAVGLSETEIDAAHHGTSDDPAVASALSFALAVMSATGRVSDHELSDIRTAGYDNTAIVEIIATVFMNVFTNAINHVAETVPDVPEQAEIPELEMPDRKPQ
jgi:uncharacterized peroxidase-related enzyme